MVKSKLVLIIFIGIKAGSLTADEPAVLSEFPLLHTYILEGLEENPALHQKEFELRQSLQALNQARGAFLPSVSLEARYSRAGGGREIDIPIGDMLNPVYDALNFTDPMGNPLRLDNQTVPFLREEEHETKIRAVQPVFQPALFYNYRIQKALKKSLEADRNVYKRHLVLEIKTAYYNYLKSLQLEKLYESTSRLIGENLRVNERLYDSGKATRDVVLRAQTEQYEMEQRIAEAKQFRIMAQSYFNHLLNRPLDSDIEVFSPEAMAAAVETDLDNAVQRALKEREELLQLSEAADAAGESVKLAKTRFLPGISAVVDYGYQGEIYRFGEDDDYWMASGVLSWNLFNGFQDRAKVQQADLEKKKLNKRQEEVENQIRLEVRDSYYSLEVLRNRLVKSDQRVRTAREVYRMVEKRYSEGMASQIEHIDARTSKTSAEIDHIMTRFDYLTEQARFERAIASLNIKN
jgi:outer membrane protein TolC